MEQGIVGFHQDAEQDWVARLECGHNQHVRHNPPWTNRRWVTTPEGRTAVLGRKLPCKKCDEGAPRDWATPNIMSPRPLPDRIETSRLVLRRPTQADALAIFGAYTQDPLVSRFMVWRPHTALTETNTFISSCIAAWEEASQLAYVLTEAGSSSAIGMLEARPQDFTVDLGYVLARAHWGKGYMPEAVSALAASALDHGFFRVQAFCDVENSPSQRTLEKAGFSREGRLERYMVHPNISPDPRPCFMYSRSRP